MEEAVDVADRVLGRACSRRAALRRLVGGAGAGLLAARGLSPARAAAQGAATPAATPVGAGGAGRAPIVVVPGAFLGGWHWQRVRPLLWEAGHPAFTLTLTGLGERAHLAAPETDLETHIQDVLGTLEAEDLANAVLVGHSYGGMVIRGVADRAPDRIGLLVYFDGLLPEDGQSAADLTGGFGRGGDDPLVHPDEVGQQFGGAEGFFRFLMPDASEEDIRWTLAHLTPQPRRSFTQPLRLSNAGPPRVPRAYLYTTGVREATGGQADPLGPFAERARTEPDWIYRELATGHIPYVTAPRDLVAALLELAAAAPS